MSPYSESPSAAASGDASGSIGCGGVEIMLFGVRVNVDPMRKSVSMNNLSEYVPVNGDKNNNQRNDLVKKASLAEDGIPVGYASADDAEPQPTNGNRERKRGVPWTEDEHKLFLLGLQKVGKGDWRGISRNYVKTRTPTQVASHAQKYFLRRTNLNRRRRRTSLFDITTDSVTKMPIDEQTPVQPPTTPSLPFAMTVCGPVLFSMQDGNPIEISTLCHTNNQVTNSPTMIVHPIPIPIPGSSTMIDLNLNQQAPIEPSPISLSLSLSSEQDYSLARNIGDTFQNIRGYKTGDSLITVA